MRVIHRLVYWAQSFWCGFCAFNFALGLIGSGLLVFTILGVTIPLTLGKHEPPHLELCLILAVVGLACLAEGSFRFAFPNPTALPVSPTPPITPPPGTSVRERPQTVININELHLHQSAPGRPRSNDADQPGSR
jgi:hypothetical protein